MSIDIEVFICEWPNNIEFINVIRKVNIENILQYDPKRITLIILFTRTMPTKSLLAARTL